MNICYNLFLRVSLFTFQKLITLKTCIFDTLLENPKCVWLAGWAKFLFWVTPVYGVEMQDFYII